MTTSIEFATDINDGTRTSFTVGESMAVVGYPGTGKTQVGRAILRDAVKKGVRAIVIDADGMGEYDDIDGIEVVVSSGDILRLLTDATYSNDPIVIVFDRADTILDPAIRNARDALLIHSTKNTSLVLMSQNFASKFLEGVGIASILALGNPQIGVWASLGIDPFDVPGGRGAGVFARKGLVRPVQCDSVLGHPSNDPSNDTDECIPRYVADVASLVDEFGQITADAISEFTGKTRGRIATLLTRSGEHLRDLGESLR